MKKSIFTIALIAITFTSTFAGSSNKVKVTDYVVTDEGITYVTKLRTGIDNTLTATNEFGEKIKFNKEEVKSYRKNGREYKSLYYVNEGSNFVNKTFMQRIFTRAGYSIYKNTNQFYVYLGDQLELKINKENYKVVLSFFFPKFNELFSK